MAVIFIGIVIASYLVPLSWSTLLLLLTLNMMFVVIQQHRLCPTNLLVPQKPSFVQYAYYMATLRTKYYIVVLFRYIKHFLRKIQSHRDVNYAHYIAQVFVNTSLMIHQTEVVEDQATFSVKEFHVPHKNTTRSIISLVVTIDLSQMMCIECKVDGQVIPMHVALQLISWLITVCTHTHAHAEATKGTNISSNDWSIERASIYTLSINMAALIGTHSSVYYQNMDGLLKLFEKNLAIPTDHNLKLEKLIPFSRTALFLLESRSVTYQLVQNLNLPINPRGLYMNIVHSIDHIFYSKAVPYTSLFCETDAWCEKGDLIRALFTDDLGSNGFADTKLKSSSIQWHQVYYKQLCKIDTELADLVDWCIAYECTFSY